MKDKFQKRTKFQKTVWEEIKKIPYGQTRTYKEIAKAIGNPFAYRAVGQACKRNPHPISIPCHRVIRSNGSFGGYSGGKKKKKALLGLEKSGRR